MFNDNIETIKTERLILREIINDDAKEIFEIFSDEDVAKYDWFELIKDTNTALKFIQHYKEEFDSKDEITWGIALKDSNELIGICCLGDFELDARRAEIGYDIKKSEWNKGYATEALKAVVQYGLCNMNLNRIEAFITPGNDASVKVLKKIGFTQEGIVRERDLIKGKLEDGIIMAMLKKDIDLSIISKQNSL